MYCEKCRKELDEGAEFCIYCGAKVKQYTEDETIPLADDDRTEILTQKPENGNAEKPHKQSSLNRGMILGDTYEIIEEIGSGGGGIVYKARHLRLQTDVVVKKIKDEVRGKVKSRQEADILKQLKHPYLPRVYDFIEAEDGVYTVMDFIHGENLDEAIKKHGRYLQKQVKKWAEQLGEALDYLHGQNPPVVHSDIKPANIMLTEDGDVCLIDFNISLAMGSDMESAVGISAGFSPPEQYRDPAMYERITHNYTVRKSINARSEVRGTAEELSRQSTVDDKTVVLPEKDGAGKAEKGFPKYIQYIGKGIDARSDIYSLGVTLYFLLNGEAPSMDFDERIPIENTGVPVSEGFAVIIDKMMALAPEERYRNGGEFLKAIRNSHKLDHRYIVMHRKQTAMQAASLVFLGLGIVTVVGGLAKMRREQNGTYYAMIQQAQEVMAYYDFEEAENVLNEAMELADTRVEAYEEKVYLLYLKGDYTKCIKTGEMYINAAPFLTETKEDKELLGNIYYIVGNAYFEREDYANAERFFAAALEYHAQNGLYYRDHAIALAKLGRVEQAEEELETGITKGLGEDSIYMAQGEIAHVKNQYEAAAEYLNRVFSMTDDMQMKKRAVLLCADVYRSMGNEAVDMEIALLEQYRDQFDGNGDMVITEYLAEAYARKAQMDEAGEQACYEKSLELFKSIYEKGYVTYQIQENMAILYENMQQFEMAENMLKEMAEKYPERYEVYKRLAYLEADREQMKENVDRHYEQMFDYYKKAVEMYSGKEQDMEMEMLDIMIQELRDGGWL